MNKKLKREELSEVGFGIIQIVGLKEHETLKRHKNLTTPPGIPGNSSNEKYDV